MVVINDFFLFSCSVVSKISLVKITTAAATSWVSPRAAGYLLHGHGATSPCEMRFPALSRARR